MTLTALAHRGHGISQKPSSLSPSLLWVSDFSSAPVGTQPAGLVGP